MYIYIKRKRERVEKDELLFLESALVKCVRILRQRVVFILSWCCKCWCCFLVNLGDKLFHGRRSVLDRTM